jgi:hypothetical protein
MGPKPTSRVLHRKKTSRPLEFCITSSSEPVEFCTAPRLLATCPLSARPDLRADAKACTEHRLPTTAGEAHPAADDLRPRAVASYGPTAVRHGVFLVRCYLDSQGILAIIDIDAIARSPSPADTLYQSLCCCRILALALIPVDHALCPRTPSGRGIFIFSPVFPCGQGFCFSFSKDSTALTIDRGMIVWVTICVLSAVRNTRFSSSLLFWPINLTASLIASG